LTISVAAIVFGLVSRRLVRRYKKLPQLDMFTSLLAVVIPAYLFGGRSATSSARRRSR